MPIVEASEVLVELEAGLDGALVRLLWRVLAWAKKARFLAQVYFPARE